VLKLRTTLLTALFGLLLAASPVTAQAVVSVELEDRGTLLEGGSAALVRVSVTCDAPGQVLEAFVILQQRRTSGQGAIAGIACDGVTRSHAVRVQAIDGPFRPGPVDASAFVLVCDQSGACQQGQDSERLLLRRTPG